MGYNRITLVDHPLVSFYYGKFQWRVFHSLRIYRFWAAIWGMPGADTGHICQNHGIGNVWIRLF